MDVDAAKMVGFYNAEKVLKHIVCVAKMFKLANVEIRVQNEVIVCENVQNKCKCIFPIFPSFFVKVKPN